MELKGGVGRNDPVPLTCQDGNASIARAEEQTVSLPARTRTMAVTSAAGLGRPRRWAAGLAWGLWALAMLGLAVVPWMDRLIIRAGRPDLAAFVPGSVVGPVVAVLSATTVGAVLASRRPRHPVGWLLLGFALLLTASGVISSYVTYGLVVRPGALPAANLSARLYGPLIYLSLAIIGFVLLLTPTGSPPTRRWRWWGRVSTGALAVVLVAATVAPGSLDPVRMTVRGPLDPLCYGGALRAAHVLAQAVAVLIILAGGGSLVVRYRRARGLERLQLRWVTLAAALTGVAYLAYAVLLALGSRLADWISAGATTFLPLAAGAAILRYRLYDLDRIVSRTLAYGLLTVLLGLGYAAVVLGLGRLLGQDSSLVVAAATLAVAAAFQPARRRVQGAVDRRFNRRRHDAARIIEGFGARLRDQVDLDTLTADLLAVVDQTMQPTQASLWLRPQAPSRTAGVTLAQQRT